MKSYLKHLESTLAPGEAASTVRKPVFRSAAIFPVLHGPEITTRISFLGYWLLKRHIPEVRLVYTLRDQRGAILSRHSLLIDKVMAFDIDVEALLPSPAASNFIGSIELEVFSTRDLVFPYPAFVLTYHGAGFSTSVHTTGRIYNDAEDWADNEEVAVPESGFDVYPGDHYEPFVAFTNGPLVNATPRIFYTLVNAAGLSQDGDVSLPKLGPYETVFLHLKQHVNLSFLGAHRGTIKLRHNFSGFFPRFIAGTFERQRAASITHTYYDCSLLTRDQDYWERRDARYYDSAVLIPLFAAEPFYTELVLYPVFSPSTFTLSIVFLDADGRALGEASPVRQVNASDVVFQHLDLASVARENGVPIERAFGANVIAEWASGSRIPTRLKLGLNVGIRGRALTLPSNICFAPQIGNPNVAQKAGTFRWAPLVNVGNSMLIVTNGSPLKQYDRPANLVMKFFRGADETFLQRTATIPPNGQFRIDLQADPELSDFLEGRTGWVAVEADNPFVNGWYFDFNESGAVGGDHVF